MVRKKARDAEATREEVLQSPRCPSSRRKGLHGARVEEIAKAHRNLQTHDLLLFRQQGRPIRRRAGTGLCLAFESAENA